MGDGGKGVLQQNEQVQVLVSDDKTMKLSGLAQPHTKFPLKSKRVTYWF